jgi:hypothetical protein
MIDRYKIEHEQEWREWIKKIPAIKFPAGWEVKIIPPFGGAMARFMVIVSPTKSISVYLDCFDALGYFGSPYWEIYPYNDDTYRCAMDNVDELITALKHSVKQVRKDK